MIKKAFQFIVLAAVFSGCKEVIDLESPVVVIESPTNGESILTDSDLRLVASLTDNTGLLQYKITINGIDSLNDVGADSTLSQIYIKGIPSRDKALYLDEVIELSDNTFNGYYVATLTCIDIEGNEAIRDTVRFQIKNSNDSEPPVFNVVVSIAGDTLGFGEGFGISGNVTDSQSLIYSEIFIGRSDFSDTIRFTTFPWISNNIVNYDDFGWWTQVDSSWSQGAYHLYFTAWDNYSGVSDSIPFYVSY